MRQLVAEKVSQEHAMQLQQATLRRMAKKRIVGHIFTGYTNAKEGLKMGSCQLFDSFSFLCLKLEV